ncbi:MAG: hypothetical protein LBU34_10290 [Planctomycetaceae bacterium]|jgi:hypothetical protein|nr:hypothetical protein [Planctomycetaceae bacterium]
MSTYLPRRDSELVAWGTNFTGQINLHLTEWSIPSDEYYALNTALQNFVHLHMQVDSPAKTHTLVIEKDAARKEFERLVRGLVDFRLKNPIITDAQRSDLGLPIHDRKPTPIPKPKTHPDFVILVNDLRQLLVDFHEHESENKARPYGYNGAVISYAILDKPPAGPEELTHTVLATRTPFTLEFTEQERGKTVYIAIQWQNEKGEKGLFSAIQSAIVP